MSLRPAVVPTSAMPSGVEHPADFEAQAAAKCVPTSVMPSGVEDKSLCEITRFTKTVPTSVMPSGVEHRWVWRGNCCDAGPRQNASNVRLTQTRMRRHHVAEGLNRTYSDWFLCVAGGSGL